MVSKYAVCPTCGAPLNFHTIANPDYLENGYLPQWEHYKKWLTATLNKKLCILELGVDFTFPQVIRFPFEKTAFYNKKAVFVRVNSRFPQLEQSWRPRDGDFSCRVAGGDVVGVRQNTF